MMKKTFYVSIIYLFLWGLPCISQIDEYQYLKRKHIEDFNLIIGVDSFQSYYISLKPVTNREYITYLCWLENVYKSYPEQLIYAFPSGDKGIELNSEDVISLNTLIEKSDNLIKNYMFNPKYIDYPVLGVDYEQSARFCNWLSDRYNEYSLIQNKYLGFNPNQTDDNCFTTESFLAEQYEGYRLNEIEWDREKYSFMDFMWQKGLFLPLFRLPTKYELESVSNINLLKTKFLPYKSLEFLKLWESFKITGNQYQFMQNGEIPNSKLPERKYAEIPIPKFDELYLDMPLDHKDANIINTFKNLKYKILSKEQTVELMKDSLGKMPYHIIMEDSNNQLIIVQKSKDQIINHNQSESIHLASMSIFRVAFCAIRKK
jgi:hypothetical protein